MLAIIEDSLVISRPLPSNGFTYTLAPRLGQMLADAEAQFGQRDKSFTILGIEFGHQGPRVWFPQNRKDVIIQLRIPFRERADPLHAFWPGKHSLELLCYTTDEWHRLKDNRGILLNA